MTLPAKPPRKDPNRFLIRMAGTLTVLAVVFGLLWLGGALDDEGPDAQLVTREDATATTGVGDLLSSDRDRPHEQEQEPPPAATEPAPPSQAQQPDLNLLAVGPQDRFSIPSLGVDAPLSFRIVGEDALLTDPDGPDDVAYYNFATWPGYGGGPGLGGNAVFAGHVDSGYSPCKDGTVPPPCAAVFWDLTKLNLEDEINVTVEGETFRYSVISNETVGEDASWASIFASTVDEIITVVTCGGDFDPQTRNYDKRQVVTAVRIGP